MPSWPGRALPFRPPPWSRDRSPPERDAAHNLPLHDDKRAPHPPLRRLIVLPPTSARLFHCRPFAPRPHRPRPDCRSISSSASEQPIVLAQILLDPAAAQIPLPRFHVRGVMAETDAKKIHARQAGPRCETNVIPHRTDTAAVKAITHSAATCRGASRNRCRPCRIAP